MSDEPIAFREDGSPIFDNAPSVVVLAVYQHNPTRLLVIKRATNPGMGLLALPGGYQMAGQSWQSAGCREVKEEVGLTIKSKDVKLITVISDHYGNNVIFGAVKTHYDDRYIKMNKDEVLEASFLDKKEFELSLGHWAFPTHALIADFMFRMEKENA